MAFLQAAVVGPHSPHHCDICNLSCPGLKGYNEHLRGRKHKKMEDGRLVRPIAERKTKVSVHRCDLCGITCTGKGNYNAHIRGAKHRKNGLHQTVANPIPVPQLTLTKPKALFRCDLCGITCNGVQTYKSHVLGAKHQKKVKSHQAFSQHVSKAEPMFNVTKVPLTAAVANNKVGKSKMDIHEKGHKSKKERPSKISDEASGDDDLWEENNASGIIDFDRHYDLPVEVSGGTGWDQEFWRDFRDAGFPFQLMNNLTKAGIEKPTPVQRYAMRWISLGRDVMACAETGFGKTLAFLLPILSAMMTSPNQEQMMAREGKMQEPIALIVEPTRELAAQVMREVRKFGSGTLAKPAVAYGGLTKLRQRKVLQRGCNILIATPGRLLDFINSGIVGLSKCKFLVLDEADRLLEKGFAKGDLENDECFRKQTKELVKRCGMLPPHGIERRQTLMFSATYPKEVQKFAEKPYFLDDHIFITVGKVGAANIDIRQEVLSVPRSEKRAKLIQLLTKAVEASKNDGGRHSKMTLVFVECKYNAPKVATFINKSGLPTTAIHRPLEQIVREGNLDDFKSGQYRVLVATSVAARGLHIEGVDHVINFDMPLTIEDYVHRIGRTGRMGKPGRATSFFDPEKDSGVARDVLKIMTEAHQEIPSWFMAQCEKLCGGARFVDAEEE